MTLRQLRYIDMVARKGSITEAAAALFITQPSLTAAIQDLEEEMRITIFNRSKKGVTLTPAGEEFLGYARQILDQSDWIEERYAGKAAVRQRFCVSAQHYSFVVEAFVDLLKEYGGDSYEFHIRETQTYDIIDDVSHLRSEIGILYLNDFNRTILLKTMKENHVRFHSLFEARPHVFLGAQSPLARKRRITIEDLAPYPRLSYEQGAHNSFYFSEEILSTLDSDKEIVVCDRATLFNLLIGMNGYTICSGVISEELNGPNIVARPLAIDDYMEIGYILPENVNPGRLTTAYIKALQDKCVPT